MATPTGCLTITGTAETHEDAVAAAGEAIQAQTPAEPVVILGEPVEVPLQDAVEAAEAHAIITQRLAGFDAA